MKNILLISCCFLLLALTSFAAEHELDEGSVLTSGVIHYHNQYGDGVVDRQFFHSEILFTYAIKPGLFVGGDFYSNIDNSRSDSWWIGPIVIYYFNAPNRSDQFNQIFPFVDAYYVYGNESSLQKNMLGVQAGLLVFVSEHVGIDFLVSFERITYSELADNNVGYQVFTGFGLSTFLF